MQRTQRKKKKQHPLAVHEKKHLQPVPQHNDFGNSPRLQIYPCYVHPKDQRLDPPRTCFLAVVFWGPQNSQAFEGQDT